MKLKEIKNWIENLPIEFLEFDVVNAEDGTTTKDGIKEAIEDMDKSFDKVINEMNTLREKCRVIMSYHCV